MDMVERVAQAIEEAQERGYNGPKVLARTAIAAMREPTEEMIYSPHVRTTIVGVWQGMIDAALREKPLQ